MVKTKIFILFVLTCFFAELHSQDPLFSQFYSNPLELNPALAGVSGGTRVGLNYRNQWSNLNAQYVTYAIGADHFFADYNSGVGVSLLIDNAALGIIRTINAELTYAYELKTLWDNKVRLGFQAGIISANLDYDKLIFYDAIDPEFGPISPGGIPYPTGEIPPDFTKVTRIDAGAGILYLSKKFYAGLSLKHLARPDISFYNPVNTKRGLPIRTVLHAGYQIDIADAAYGKKSALSIIPNILIARQANTGQVVVGSLVQFSVLNAGVYYRHAFKNPDAIIGTIGFEFDNFKAGYSYDATISKLSFSTGGTHEIFISASFNQEPESKYDCRKIFR